MQSLVDTPSCSVSDDPAAEQTCEGLLMTALETDPGNAEALQMFASVRMSQSRPDEARDLLERSWLAWKDLEPGKMLYSTCSFPSCQHKS
jgi:hypothetical protein